MKKYNLYYKVALQGPLKITFGLMKAKKDYVLPGFVIEACLSSSWTAISLDVQVLGFISGD